MFNNDVSILWICPCTWWHCIYVCCVICRSVRVRSRSGWVTNETRRDRNHDSWLMSWSWRHMRRDKSFLISAYLDGVLYECERWNGELRQVGSQKHRSRTQVQVGRVNSMLWRHDIDIVYMYMFYYDLGSCDLIWGASAAGTRRKSQL